MSDIVLEDSCIALRVAMVIRAESRQSESIYGLSGKQSSRDLKMDVRKE